MAGISSKALKPGYADNKIKFQGQEFASKEFSDGGGLDMYEFKWRMHDPQTGRFWQVDPLSDKYVYNSTYAFSENKVTSHVELEGLEAEYMINQFKSAVKKEFVNAGKQVDRTVSVYDKKSVSTEVLKTSVMTKSVGSTTTTTTSSNFGGLMSFLTTNNTLNGFEGPFIKSQQSTTLDTKTEAKIGKTTVTNKTSVDVNTGEVTNETGVKSTINVRGANVTVEGSGGQSSDGKSKASVQASVGTNDSKVFTNGSMTTSNKGSNVSLGMGVQQKTGKTTTSQSFGIIFSW